MTPSIKWPNDILCGDRKLCGILCETAGDFIIAGIGINCLQTVFQGDYRRPPTSILLETGKVRKPAEVLEAVLFFMASGITDSGWKEKVLKRL